MFDSAFIQYQIFGSFEEFKTFLSGVLVTAIAQCLYWLKATGDACGGH
ncbi:hypothetical protein [Nostoc sp.]